MFFLLQFSRLFSWPKRDWTGAPPLKIEPGEQFERLSLREQDSRFCACEFCQLPVSFHRGLGDGFLKELLPQERDEQPLDPEQRGEMSGYHGVSVYTFRGADGVSEAIALQTVKENETSFWHGLGCLFEMYSKPIANTRDISSVLTPEIELGVVENLHTKSCEC